MNCQIPYTMKKLFLFLIALFSLYAATATEQYPDIIEYGKKKYELYVDWGHPSPLQTLYIRTNTESPFKGYSTANYRGHIATWRIRDGKLYLVSVNTQKQYGRTGTYFPSDDNNTDTTAAPGFFAITSLSQTPPESDGAVFADWYSGVLSLGAPITKKNKKSKFKGNRLIYVRNGEVVDNQFLEKKDYERIGNITYKDTSDHKFMDKYRLAYLNQCFLSYYFQSGMNRDKVLFQGHTGRFSSVDFRPIIMSLFNYDPLQFPFNWENFERNGAPVCTWSISGDSLFINSITLMQGLNFDQDNNYKYEVGLDEIFKTERVVDNRVFAFWMNGEYIVEYGEETTNSIGMNEFRLERHQRILLDSGRIVQSVWTPSSFDADTQQAHSIDCDPQNVFRCDHWGVRDRYKDLPEASTLPYWTDGNDALQAWFDGHQLDDPRAKKITFRTVLRFKVNCHGAASEWAIASKGEGLIFELSNKVLEIAKQLPNGWSPATNADGNAVDCWQVLQFSIQDGQLKCSLVK